MSVAARRTSLPVVTIAILAVNAVLLIAEAVVDHTAGGLLSPSSVALCRLGALNTPAIAESDQYWRLATVMVLHAGIIHFAFNSYALWIYGPTVERLLGGARYLALYVGAGLVGSAASFTLHHTELGVGASGAIFGVLGALVVVFFRRRHQGGEAALRQLAILVAINLVLLPRLASVDSTAHVGGLLGGMLGMALLETPLLRSRRRSWLALAAPFAVAAALTAYGVVTYVPSGLPTCVGA